MSDELKPCPFCGNYAVETDVDGDMNTLSVHCNLCGARGPTVEWVKLTREVFNKAEEEWNIRTTQ